MKDARIVSYSGSSAVMGGVAWIAATVMHASQPRGCVGDECFTVPMREATTATALLVAVAGLMMVASGAGLLALIRRRNGLAWQGRLGAALCGLGIASLALGVTLQEVVFGEDFSWMPAFVGPGVLSLAAGVVLIAWTVLRSQVLPAWSGLGLLAGGLLVLGVNEQTSAILLALPFGLAWAAAGVTLLLRRSSATTNRSGVLEGAA